MSIDYSKMAFPKGLKTNYTGCTKDISKTNREKIKKLFKGKCVLCGQTRSTLPSHNIQKRR